jgi:hypothetical protein
MTLISHQRLLAPFPSRSPVQGRSRVDHVEEHLGVLGRTAGQYQGLCPVGTAGKVVQVHEELAGPLDAEPGVGREHRLAGLWRWARRGEGVHGSHQAILPSVLPVAS